MQQDNINKLLKTLKRKRDKKLTYQDDVLNFLEYYGIKRGRQQIRKKTLKNLYNAWSKNPLDTHALSTRLNDCLASDTGNYYNINKNAFDLSVDLYEPKAKKQSHVSVKSHNRILEFVKDYGLEQGEYWTESTVLYSFFKDWCKESNLKITFMGKFVTILKLHFSHTKNMRKRVVFGLNYNLTDLLTPQKLAALTRESKEENK